VLLLLPLLLLLQLSSVVTRKFIIKIHSTPLYGEPETRAT